MPPIRTALALLALLTLSPPLSAREATEAERAAVSASFSALSAAAQAGDTAAMVALLPPGILARQAEATGQTETALRTFLASYLAKDAPAKLRAFRADPAAARWLEDEAGEPVAIVPTLSEFESATEGRLRIAGHMLAFRDGAGWFLVDLSNPVNAPQIRAAYPAMPDLTVPPARIERLGGTEP